LLVGSNSEGEYVKLVDHWTDYLLLIIGGSFCVGFACFLMGSLAFSIYAFAYWSGDIPIR